MADKNKTFKNNPKNKESPLYTALTRLFSGPVVNYRQQAQIRFKRRDLDRFKFTSAGGQSFKKKSYNPFEAIQSNIMANQSRAERYSDFDQMEFMPEVACITSDTVISTLEGFFSVDELLKKYPNGENFEVWAWDNEKCQYTIGNAHSLRKTGTKVLVQVNLDNGEFLKCTPDHRILLKDGTYKQASELVEGDSVMPFDYRINSEGYMKLRTKDFGKYKQVHRYIHEDIFENEIGDLNVHHINEIKTDNRTLNLQLLTADEHRKIHHISEKTRFKKQKSSIGLWDNEEYREAALFGLRKWQNSEEGKKFMSERTSYINKKRWKEDLEYARKMSEIFSTHAKKLWENEEWAIWKRQQHSRNLILKYKNDSSYKLKVAKRKHENGRYVNIISTESILLEGIKFEKLADLARNFDFGDKTFTNDNYKIQFINRRLREAGYNGWKDYKDRYAYSNHKVVSVVPLESKEDVYDLTVDHYENFCLKNGMIISNSAMDIYADEMTTSNQFRPLLSIDCKNEEIKTVLHSLFYKTLNVEQNLYGWCRTMCKFGDFFLYLDIDEKLGIKSVLGLPSPEVERLEGEDESNPNYVQFQWNSAQMTFENWQVAHFRILGQDKYSPYGTSILEPARRIWRQLQLLEDAMMAYRIVRAPDRRVFKIDVGNIPPQDVEQYMQKIITQMKRNQIVDPTTGRVDLRYNPMSIDEDYFIPVRGTTTGTTIDTLAGGNFVGDIDDVKYLRDKLFSALKIPQAYLARGEGAAEDKTMLAQKDIRFARTIQRLQRIIINELEKIGMIHLYTLGFRNEDILKFKLRLHNPSKLAELQELEHLDKQLAVANSAKEQGISKHWIFDNILKFSEHDFLKNQRELAYDAAFSKSLEAAGAGEEAGGGIGGLGSLGGGEAGGAPGELPAPGGETGGEAAAGAGGETTPPATGETGKESPLLAAPARREDGTTMPYLTPGAKGKAYKPVVASQNGSGARKRSYSASAGSQVVSGADRAVFKGMSGLNTLARGLTEDVKMDPYEKDEQLLMEVQQKLESLDKNIKKKQVIGENKDEAQ